MLRKTLLLSLTFVSLNALAAATPKNFDALLAKCAPGIDPATMTALVRTESSFNPYAIGVVGGSVKQPTNFVAAMMTIADLEAKGASYSVGIAQIHKSNFKRFGIDAEKALDVCTNLRVAAAILGECFTRAKKTEKSDEKALQAALSCYYSGNFETGKKEGYVKRIEANAQADSDPDTDTKVLPVPSVAILTPKESLLTLHDSCESNLSIF